MSSSGQAGIAIQAGDDQSPYLRQLHNVATVYNIYRIVLPIVLLLTYVSSYGTPTLGIINPQLFVQIASGYAVLGLVAIVLPKVKPALNLEKRYLTAVFLLDILILSLLAFLSGGVVSGLTLLLLVNIAFANMLLPGRIGIFIAAVATLAIIYCEAYLTLNYTDYPGQFIQSGILGIILFATSLYIQSASKRARDAARLVEVQATSIVDLEKLNNEIIQRMRTGIMVVNADDEIITLNNAAHSLLGPILESATVEGKTHYRLPKQLLRQISSWRDNPFHQGGLIKVPGPNVNLQASFAYLTAEADSDILVFIENQSRIMQRIRQSKLASLGRLTANIAHEIRNPLGAISHAGQMLQESEHLSSDEDRMLEIILNQSNRMNRIIEEVLDVSRHKDGAPSLIDLRTWMSDFVQQYQESSSECDEIDFD
ncbi:MAG: PAS domain-containing sensor histidine kinase, partial [Gammaproteobacteria bacterium]|nr:PAS domain-containing sensor histidine kinase [Gammaproteobacteria bacterium]